MGLERDLADFQAEFERTAPPGRAALYSAEFAELRARFALENILAVGGTAPDFALPDVHGRMIALPEALHSGPVILAFYRGGWRPYCVLQLRAYQSALPTVVLLGGHLISASPKLPDGSLSTVEKNGLEFDVSSDVGNGVAHSFGLVYSLPEELREALRSNGKDLKPPGGLRLVGYLIIVGGLAALVIGNAPSNRRPSLGGITSLILAAAMWGIYTLRFRPSGLTLLEPAALICFWSALLDLPPYLLFGLSHLDNASVQELMFHVVYQGLLMSVVAVVAFNRAVTLLGAGAGTAIIALLPVIVAALAVPVLGEIPSRISSMAIGAIAVGVLLAARPAPSRSSV
jgi:peroxiredoxin